MIGNTSGAELWTAIGTVGATVAAVFVALIWQPLRERWRRPVLSLHFDEGNSRVETQQDRLGRTRQAFYVRLAVSNASGKDAARETQVLVQEVSRLTPDGEQPIQATGALNWKDVNVAFTLTVGAGVTRWVDLGSIPELVDDDPHPYLALGLLAPPADDRHKLKPGKYSLRVTLTASNCNAIFYDAVLGFDGEVPVSADDIDVSVRPVT